MAEKMPESLEPSAPLVRVRAVLPERIEGEGALLIMRDGSFRAIIRCGTIDYDMRAPHEREGIALAFGAMLDSLDEQTPIEIVSHVKALDTEAYVRQYEGILRNDRTPPQIRAMAKAHVEYYHNQVKAQNLLQREIYLVVPYKKMGGPVTESFADQIPFAQIWRKAMRAVEDRYVHGGTLPNDQEIGVARNQLHMRCEDIAGRLQQMGVEAHMLDESEVVQMLYEVYHPSLSQRQRRPNFQPQGSFFSGLTSSSPPALQQASAQGRRPPQLPNPG